ncbi:MAG: S41 family peptidase [Bacteroidaceae bacterium]|nr:S41 family peptidase [Bacteroidaceae bacterium]
MKKVLYKNLLAAICLSASCSACAQTEHNFEVSKNLDIFNSLYRELDVLYVDTLDAKKVIGVGIDAMLSTLDPYTEYYSEEDMGDLKIMTTGKYGGIGAIIRMRKDSTIIIGEPYEGMPAAEVGLKVGDVIMKVDDKEVTKKMMTSDVSDMLRGEPGTTFVLRIKRPGEKKTRDFKITRKNIKLPAIAYTGIIDGIGYINLTQFTEGCAKDVRKSVINLKEKGATGIVLDLRNNGGGLLAEAVDIVNLFVPKDLKIVETKGKVKSANAVYNTKSDPLDLEIPLAVLVNGNTASAAEIVSGSLQDLDRATIIGLKTFGKGLVQSPRDLPYNGSIKLTTSKYYIPSGRCIQAIDYKKKRDGEKSVEDDSLKHIFYTSKGRVVKDGGGIMPDIVMKHDTLPNILFYLGNDDVLVDWGTKYVQNHKTIPAVAEFKILDEDFNEFKSMVKDADFKYDRLSEKRLDDLKKVAKFEGYYDDAKDEFDALEAKLVHNLDRDLELHKKDIKKMMAQEIIKRYYFQAGSVEEALKDDDDLKKAIEILKK